MSIKNLKCECCMGNLKQLNKNIYKCESCGQEYIDNINTEEEIIWLASANKTLRLGNFDDAYEEFSNIITKYPNNYEAYYGLCLCNHGVLFVDDVLENKKVPTCYNITISSFLDDDNYKKTLELCPKELKANFEEQARKIEVIRKEWLEKASKEQPYDIFISFKQSDREKGIDKTKDYYSALELYNYLTYKQGLKVFFSPETLKNKISEQYEPYIYNALKTSKVMIVYGEKKEYLNSTWVKNEWIRYLRKIKNKEKEPNSLVVVYKGFDAYELPKELKNLQALKVDSLDFLDTLINHINKIFEKEVGKQKIERKEIKVGQVATRSRTIGSNQIVKRELGSNVITTKDATIAKILDSVQLLINHSHFDMANTQLISVLEKEPNNGIASYLKYLVDNKISGSIELQDIISTGKRRINIEELEELITKIDKHTATSILITIRDSLINKIKNNYEPSKGFVPSLYEDDILNLYNLLSHYEYEGSKDLNKLVLDASAVNGAYLKLFNQALRTLEDTEVDEYIAYHISFVKNIKDDNLIDKAYIKEHTKEELSTIKEIKEYILKRALKVDEGNSNILTEMFAMTYDITYLEFSLKYAKDTKESNSILSRYIKKYSTDLNAPYEEIVKYIPSDNQELYKKSLELRYNTLKKAILINNTNKEKYISVAKYYLEQIILEVGETPERLYDLFKYNLGCVSDDDLVKYPIKLSEMPEFVLMLAKFEQSTQENLMNIINKQNAYHKKLEEDEKRKQMLAEAERLRIEEAAAEISLKKKKIRRDIIVTIWIFSLIFIGFYMMLILGDQSGCFADSFGKNCGIGPTLDKKTLRTIGILSPLLPFIAAIFSILYSTPKEKNDSNPLMVISGCLCCVFSIICAVGSGISCSSYLTPIFVLPMISTLIYLLKTKTKY